MGKKVKYRYRLNWVEVLFSAIIVLAITALVIAKTKEKNYIKKLSLPVQKRVIKVNKAFLT